MVAIRNEPGSFWQSARLGMRRAARKIAQAISRVEEPSLHEAGALLVEFAEAARRADSFAQAQRLGANWRCCS
jgi:hypothetical protein